MEFLLAWLWVAAWWLIDGATEHSLALTSTPFAAIAVGFLSLVYTKTCESERLRNIIKGDGKWALCCIVSIDGGVRVLVVIYKTLSFGAWLCVVLPCRVLWWIQAALWSLTTSTFQIATSGLELLARPVPLTLLCLCAAAALISRPRCIPHSQVVLFGLAVFTTYFSSPAPLLTTCVLLGLAQMPRLGDWLHTARRSGKAGSSLTARWIRKIVFVFHSRCPTPFVILTIWLAVDQVLDPCRCIRVAIALGLLLLLWSLARLRRKDPEAATSKLPPSRFTHGTKQMKLYHITRYGAEIKASGRMHLGKSGYVGGGIYFAESVEAARVKAKSSGYLVIAKVLVGEQLRVDVRRTLKVPKETFASLFFLQGYDSIHLVGPRTGPEVVVFNSDQVEIVDVVELSTWKGK
mmetsp:Transcript_10414/g.23576  ORF Transcript_10414/g.23576 Transcript_10414/m.23576 type:complete len:405 (-) Transcript_10414:360-1574(-)